MKKLFIISIILSILISTAAGVYFNLCIAAETIDFTVNDNNKQLYSITKIANSTYMQIVNSSGGTVNNISLPAIENKAEKEYSHVNFFSGKLYISGYLHKNGSVSLYVDRYDSTGRFEERCLQVENTEKYDSHMFAVSLVPSDNVLQVTEILNQKQIRFNLFDITSEDNTVRLLTPEEGICVYNAVMLTDTVMVLDEDGNLYKADKDGKFLSIDTGNAVIYDIIQENNTGIYFTDVSVISGKQGFYTKNANGETAFEITTVHDSKKYIYHDVTFDELRDFKLTAAGNYAAKHSGNKKIYYIPADDIAGSQTVEYMVYGYTAAQIIVRCFLVFAMTLIVIMCGGLAVRRALASRKILIKQILIMVLVVIIIPVPAILFVNSYILNIMQRSIIDYMVELAYYFNLNIDGSYFAENGLTAEQVKEYKDFDSVKKFDKNVDIYPGQSSLWGSLYSGEDFKFDYLEIAKLRGGEYYYEYVDGAKKGGLVKYTLSESNLEKLKSKGEGDYMVTFSEVSGIQWLEVTGIICNEKGEQSGYVQIITDNTKIYEFMHNSGLIVSVLTESVAIIISVGYLLILRRLLTPLKLVKNAAVAIADGKIGTVITGNKTNDELQDISDSFNDMSLKLKRYFDNINLISKAYEKFVPKDFFLLMGNDNIFDVKSGERVQCLLTFLFISIDNAWDTDGETDDFIRVNTIYSIVADRTAQRGGIIQSYDDDSILVVFKSQVTGAVEAALEINERVNSVLKKDAAKLSYTVQNKISYIGVIGSNSTMKCVSVSPAINLQRCINRIINTFKLGCVITEDAYSELPSELQINCRYIGTIGMLQAEIKDAGERLYEVIDICPAAEKKQKLSYKREFDGGLVLYSRGDFRNSRTLFINALRTNRSDLLVKYYLENIEERIGG